MFINLNENQRYMTSHDCNECKHRDLCKWTSLMVKKKKQMEELKKDDIPFNPLRVTITCNNFEKKTKFSNDMFL